jgi:iron complex outermembrane recepter protein
MGRIGENDMKYQLIRCLLASTAAIVAVATPALAQDSSVEAAKPAAETTIGDIVVTARRSEESLSKVPVAVAAFSPQELTERRIVSEVDLQASTPGLTVRSTNSSEQLSFSLRGQSIDAFSYGAPAVVAYFNETQIKGVATSAFYDLSSIQVLKGPQGTLFGRNATGGAVLYGTQEPTDKFEGYIRGGFGNLGNTEAEASINIPLAEGAALRFAGRFQKRDGFQHNLYDDTFGGSVDSKSVRASLRLEPSSGIKNVTVVQHGTGKGIGTNLKTQNINLSGSVSVDGKNTPLSTAVDAVYNLPLGFEVAPGVPFYTAAATAKLASLGVTGGIRDFVNRVSPGLGHHEVLADVSAYYNSNAWTVTNRTEFEVNDNLTIKNIFGYNKVKTRTLADDDGSPFEVLNIGSFAGGRNQGFYLTNEDISDELQMSGELADGNLTYIAGLYLSQQKEGVNIPLTLFTDTVAATPATACANPAGWLATRTVAQLDTSFCGYSFQIDSKSYAGYAQFGYKITPELTLSLGGRVTKEKIKLDHLANDAYGDILGVPDASTSATKPSWTVGLDYQATPSLMVYVVQRGSWRTGGFNGTSLNAAGLTNEFKPETTWDIEAGAKFNGYFGSMPARFNLAVYQQTVKDIIRSVYIGITSVTGNARKARVRGFELDGSLNLTNWLQFGGTLAYTDAKYPDPIATVGTAQLSFGPYADTPEWAGSAYVRTEHDLPDDQGAIVLRGDVYGQTGVFYSNLVGSIVPGATLPGYFLVNGRAEWNNIMGSTASLSGFVKNLTNEEYFNGGIALGAVVGINARLPAIGRTYGMEIGFKF